MTVRRPFIPTAARLTSDSVLVAVADGTGLVAAHRNGRSGFMPPEISPSAMASKFVRGNVQHERARCVGQRVEIGGSISTGFGPHRPAGPGRKRRHPNPLINPAQSEWHYCARHRQDLLTTPSCPKTSLLIRRTTSDPDFACALVRSGASAGG